MGAEQERRSLQMEGLNLMDKTLFVQGARLSFRIWDVGGECILNVSCTYVHVNSALSLLLQRNETELLELSCCLSFSLILGGNE